jgi:hypothetical protein
LKLHFDVDLVGLQNELGPRFGKDGGREDLRLIDSFLWDKTLEYGRIHETGPNSTSSFYSTCGILGVGTMLIAYSECVSFF